MDEFFQIFSAAAAFGAGVCSLAEDLKVSDSVFSYCILNFSASDTAARANNIFS